MGSDSGHTSRNARSRRLAWLSAPRHALEYDARPSAPRHAIEYDARPSAPRHAIEYDALRHRLWIFGQRCHHGATGILVAVAGMVIAGPRSRVALALTGGVLIVHDWKDHSIWFERGYGSQP
jgi:hypothetical protein